MFSSGLNPEGDGLAGDSGMFFAIYLAQEIVAQNDTGEVMSASPVISGGTIYLRTFEALWAIRES